jgi:hypothetical protein
MPQVLQAPSTKSEDIKLTMGLVLFSITTQLPDQIFVSYYTHFEHVMDTRRCITYQIELHNHMWPLLELILNMCLYKTGFQK